METDVGENRYFCHRCSTGLETDMLVSVSFAQPQPASVLLTLLILNSSFIGLSLESPAKALQWDPVSAISVSADLAHCRMSMNTRVLF